MLLLVLPLQPPLSANWDREGLKGYSQPFITQRVYQAARLGYRCSATLCSISEPVPA